MKIKNIDYKLYKNYPTEKEITNKDLKNSIPSKWRKNVFISIILGYLLNTNVFAAKNIYNPSSSGITSVSVISTPMSIINIVFPIIQIIMAIFSVLSGINILILNNRYKEKIKNVNKKLKLTFIISITLFLLSFIINFFLDYIYYNV